MGLCGGGGAVVDPAARARSEAIDRELKQDRQVLRKEQKLLLLGAGESGKSTIVKQMRIIHDKGFSSDEKEKMKMPIYGNVSDASKSLIEAADKFGFTIACTDSADYLRSFRESNSFPQEFFDHAKALWADPAIQKAFARRNEFQLIDSADYFFGQIDRIRQPGYVPDDMDTVRLRVMTSGVFETKFKVNEIQFHMFDVGGQRSERRKWIQCFGDVTAIIYVASCSEYDMVLREEHSMNRMMESLELFHSIWVNRWLEKVSIILFLNKTDLLEMKLPASPLSKYFPEYDGGNDAEKAKNFIRDKFLAISTGYEGKRVYPYFTCAIDKNNVQRVFNSCRDIIQNLHLQTFGLT